MDDLVVNQSVTIPADELLWSASRSGGPGGQNVNKVSSKVDLRFDVQASRVLSNEVKVRLQKLCVNKLDGEGRIQVTSQRTRDQARNLEDARDKLATLVRKAMERPKPRRATKPSRAAKRRRLQEKRQQSEKKSQRRRIDPD